MDDDIKKVTIEVSTENHAFKNGNFAYELERILKKIVQDMNDMKHGSHIWGTYCDSNGNSCCKVTIEKEK